MTNPSESGEKTNSKPREITYQVGRKKGTIQLDKQGEPAAPAVVQTTLLEKWLEKGAWRQAPSFTMKHWLLCMYALPFIVLAAGLWLLLVLRG